MLRVLDPNLAHQKVYKNLVVATCEPVAEIVSSPVNKSSCKSVNTVHRKLNDCDEIHIPEHLENLYQASSEGVNDQEPAVSGWGGLLTYIEGMGMCRGQNLFKPPFQYSISMT